MPRKHQGKFTTASGDDLGKKQFHGTDGSDSPVVSVSIEATADANASSGAVPGKLSIKTANSSGALTEAVSFDSAQAATFAGEVSLGGNSASAPGVGISGGSGTVLKTSVVKEGGIITTRILIDLTGLNGGDTGGDVIGTNGAGVAYLMQVTAAQNGTVIGGRMSCLELPVGSNVDVDLWSANEGTGVEDTAISSLTGEVQLINHGNWAAGEIAGLVADPVADQYLYLTSGAATAGTFTAGRFLIELFGYDA